jgi:hypothetical protein
MSLLRQVMGRRSLDESDKLRIKALGVETCRKYIASWLHSFCIVSCVVYVVSDFIVQ